jgi:hypothetical protein
MMRRRKKIDVAGLCGLTGDELSRLATFNGERARGLVHTEEYRERMAKLQSRFDETTQAGGVKVHLKDGYPYLVDHTRPDNA